jgi:hypothetical protein
MIITAVKLMELLKILMINILFLSHPAHVTLTSMEQNEDSDTLKVFFRMYYDDFLNDYKSYNPAFDFNKISRELPVTPDQINDYFNDRINISVNKKLLTGRLSDLFKDNFEISFSVHYKSVRKPRKLTITNQVLIKIYNDQVNMVYLNINEYQDAVKLTSEHFTGDFTLK